MQPVWNAVLFIAVHTNGFARCWIDRGENRDVDGGGVHKPTARGSARLISAGVPGDSGGGQGGEDGWKNGTL